MEVKQKFNVVCEGISYEGCGVCRIDNIVVFVPNLLPMEKAQIEITNVKKSFAYGKVISRENDSEDRINPKCPKYFECGGCDLSHLSSKLKQSVKYDNVVNNFKKQGLEIDLTNKIENPDLYGYRSKVVMHAVNTKSGVVIGTYKKGSYEIAYDSCLMLNQIGTKLHEQINLLVNEYEVSAYNYKDKTGFLRNVIYRRNEKDEFMVIFVVSKMCKNLELVIKKLEQNPVVSSIVINVNRGNRKQLMSGDSKVIYGKSSLIYKVGEVECSVSPNSFFQINLDVMNEMYNIIKDNIASSDTVLDAYSGVGSITLHLAKSVKEIVGIEINKASFEDALSNKQHNCINNAKFINGDVSEEVSKLDYEFDVVVTDPPRSGCSMEFIDFVISNNFKKLIYMSCNSATLARDVKYLEEYYDVKKSYVFDMFAHTAHSEVLVILERK